MNEKLLITGATGFIGKRLVKACIAKKYNIRIAARQDTTRVFESCVDHCLISDISANTNWVPAVEGCHVVVHTAARVHVMNEKASDPLAEFRRVNVDGTLQLAKQAIAQGVRRFIFISSIKVNGEETTESKAFKADDPVNPTDAYAISKYEAEQGLLKLSAETGLEVVIIRPPLVYGPGVKGNFQRMLQWLKRGIPLPFGALKNKRSFVHIDNLIDLIICCVGHPNASNQIFLVSDGNDLSTTELLQKMSYELGKSPRLLPVPSGLLKAVTTVLGKKGMAQRLCGSLQVDIAKTQLLLNWQPVVKMADGLRLLVMEK